MLEVCKNLFQRWNEQNIRYCHWKSNEHLEEGLNGETDLDVYVAPSDKEAAESLLLKCQYLECETQKAHRYPNVCEWIGFDSSTGRLVHVHLHYQIITGTKFCKEYVFPIEDLIIATRVLDKDTNVYVTDPNLEIIILYSRIALKAKKKHHIRLSKGDHKEIIYLKERMQAEVVLQLSKQLMGPDGETLYKLIMEEDLSCERWYRVYQIVSCWLNPYRKYSKVHVFLRHKYYHLLNLFLKQANRKFNCCFITKKTFPNHHLSICLLGQDGSGKSTVTIELCKWLNWKIEAHRFYLGSGEHYKSFTKWLLAKLSKAKKSSHSKVKSSNNDEGIVQQQKVQSKNPKTFLIATLVSLKYLGVARRAHQQAKRADKYMRKGGIPLYDRFPQTQFQGIYDGAKISNYYHKKGYDFQLVKWMARREQRYIEKIQRFQPNIIFKLMLSPEESIRRKPFENIEAVTRKHEITQQLQFPNSVVYTVDATQDFQQEIIFIKNQIWKAIIQGQ